jgi:hypothetical protein
MESGIRIGLNRRQAGQNVLKATSEVMNPVWVSLGRDWYDYVSADFRRALDRVDPQEATADPSPAALDDRALELRKVWANGGCWRVVGNPDRTPA